jgi:hypothetical protein
MGKIKKQEPPKQADSKYPVPPFPKQKQEAPGTESQLKPLADHGEESYKGCGKLKG